MERRPSDITSFGIAAKLSHKVMVNLTLDLGSAGYIDFFLMLPQVGQLLGRDQRPTQRNSTASPELPLSHVLQTVRISSEPQRQVKGKRHVAQENSVLGFIIFRIVQYVKAEGKQAHCHGVGADV